VSRAVWVSFLLIAAVACRSSTASEEGHLKASWIGADTGGLSGFALAEWCDEQRRLEIRTIKGDTGLALAVSPEVVLSPDSYRVAIPGSRDTAPPSARLALRWFGPTAIHGFQGDSGTVILERTDSGRLTGSVVARGSSVSNSDRVTLTGEFQNLAVIPQSRGCTTLSADSV
jgi:hypothetical protein